MNTAALAAEPPKFNATIYDSFDNPTARRLFSSCDLIYNVTLPGKSAAEILQFLQFNLIGNSNYKQLNEDGRLDRYTFMLVENFYSETAAINNHYQESAEQLSAWYSTITNLVKSKLETANCSLPGSKLGREEYVFCREVLAHMSEIKARKINAECQFNTPPLISSDHLKSLSDFIIAAEKNQVALSIDPNKARRIWEDQFRETFCANNSKNDLYCSDDSLDFPFSFSDYVKNMLPHANMPLEIRAELENAFANAPPQDSGDNDEL